ncbi:MAG: hypothetical protein KGH93_02645 [Patescibacteria group bacterium]|nr:hypothetical protein [Patescibacteria group bacterium]
MAQEKRETYWLEDTIWHTPLNVIYHYSVHLDILPVEQKKTKSFRKADEMLKAAIALLGIHIDDSKQYWLQPVPDSEKTPDVRTGTPAPLVEGQPPLFETQDVEVVDFIPEPGEDIATFLGRTKLSPGKAYDAKTTILCHIQTEIYTPSLQGITGTLRENSAVCSVLVLGRTHPTRKDYALFQVHPQFKIIAEYNVKEALEKNPQTGTLHMRRGSKPNNKSRPEEKHCPFESLGFECPLIK